MIFSGPIHQQLKVVMEICKAEGQEHQFLIDLAKQVATGQLSLAEYTSFLKENYPEALNISDKNWKINEREFTPILAKMISGEKGVEEGIDKYGEKLTKKTLKKCAECGTSALEHGKLNICPCNEVRYCSKEHQVAHWKKTHKFTCTAKGKKETAEELKDKPEEKAEESSTDPKTTTPIASATDTPPPKKVCGEPTCPNKTTEVVLKLCSGCKKMDYCSATCQSKHWKVHKVECRKSTSTKS
jgi:hypothetical protein